MAETKPLSPFRQKLRNWRIDHFVGISFVEKYMFVHHLQIMTRAGLPIISSLHVLSEEIENKKLKKVIGEIKAQVETGLQLSEVLARYPKIFPPIYVNMIAAGEAAGQLEQALTQISNQMQKSHQLTSKIRGALIYPAVIMVAMVGIALFVVFYILPKIMVMFEEMDVQLPLATRILIGLTKFLQHYWWLVLIVIVLIVMAFIRLMRVPGFKRAIHAMNLRLPIFGAVVKKVNLARFTITLSSLLASTIPIIEAVRISAEVLGNVVYRDNLLSASESLKKGEPLSQTLMRSPDTFPPMVTEMIMVGEQSGQVEKMLGELSEYYSGEVDNTMNNFTAIIEPVIILLLGLGVAGIAVAVLMPMYTLAQNV